MFINKPCYKQHKQIRLTKSKLMSFLILPNIQNNNDIYKHIRIDKLSIAYKPSRADTSRADTSAEQASAEQGSAEQGSGAECNDILINKTLYKYLIFIKEQIDCRIDQWDKYKKYTNPYEYIHSLIPNTKQSISTLKPISRSFFKMIELCHSMYLMDTLPPVCTTFHLAEGPGGFIEALAYMRKNKDDTYYGMTLIDDINQNVPGWRKSKYFLQNNPNVIIETGIEKNGDLTKPENLRYCYDKYNGKMDMITGDGGFDFSFHYPQQEQISTKLIACQIGFAIAMQKAGGTFILKVYDTFTRFSLDLLFLLANLYDQVTIVKPNTSRFANSEKYVVCKGFRNSNTLEIVKQFYKILQNPEPIIGTLFDFELPYLFTIKIEEFNAIMGQQQIDTIVSTIYLIDNNNKYDKIEHIKKKNIQKCIAWCQKYDIPYNNTIQNNNLFITRGVPPQTPRLDHVSRGIWGGTPLLDNVSRQDTYVTHHSAEI
jgi:23S rRNA U2552 (ribose-2'-O)-methylase RlmE/FtsJ